MNATPVPIICAAVLLSSCFGGEGARNRCEVSSRKPLLDTITGAVSTGNTGDFLGTSAITIKRKDPIAHLALSHQGLILRVMHSADFPQFLPSIPGKADVTAFFEDDGTLLRVRLTNHEKLSASAMGSLDRWRKSLVNLPWQAKVPGIALDSSLNRGDRDALRSIQKKLQYLRAMFQIHFLGPRHRAV
ncbi:hypothetical protein KKF84_04290 [Myxococcota bacterium]|nr:hypothetical protein [Myxococcota bacterium]